MQGTCVNLFLLVQNKFFINLLTHYMSKKFAKMYKKTCRTPPKCFKLRPFAKKILKAKQK
jgi:hypothetical protein